MGAQVCEDRVTDHSHHLRRRTQIEIAGLLALSLGSYLDFWIIFALLMTNATLGFIEEMNAQASIAALKDGMVRKLPVKRDGKFTPLSKLSRTQLLGPPRK